MDDPATSATIATIEQFNDALNRHDVDAVMALMTDDCLFENTSLAPDGEQFTGQAAVRGFWEAFVRDSPQAHFTTEEIVACGDRCVTRWRYRWGADDAAGHIRGIDLFRVRDGKVAEKRAYVKG